MKQLNIVLFFLLLLSDIALSYQDLDIDGVDDSIDRCLETPFDELVDEKGCSKSQNPTIDYGEITLKIGTDIFVDNEYDSDSSLSLYANYRYSSWDISISNSRSTTNGNYSNSYSDNDIYISLGKDFTLDKDIIKLSLGTKIAGDIEDSRQNRERKYREENSSNGQNQNQKLNKDRDNDYFASINYNHLLNEKQSLFLYYEYTLSGDSECIDYQNYSSFSIGTSYLFTPNWYSAISYSYASSLYKDGEESRSIDWFSSYSFTKSIFASIGYNYALDDLSYDNSFSMILGFTF